MVLTEVTRQVVASIAERLAAAIEEGLDPVPPPLPPLRARCPRPPCRLACSAL